MKKLSSLLAFFFTTSLLASNAMSQESFGLQDDNSGIDLGFYLAGGLSRISTTATINDQTSRFDFDDSDNAFNIRAGYQFTSWFGLEAAYYDFGEIENALTKTASDLGLTDSNISLDLKGYGLSLVGIIPLKPFDLYGKLGAVRLKGNAEASAFGISFRAEDTTTQPFAAIGGELDFGVVNLFAEYSRLLDTDDIEIDLATVGIKLEL